MLVQRAVTQPPRSRCLFRESAKALSHLAVPIRVSLAKGDAMTEPTNQDHLVRAMAKAVGAVADRHIGRSAGMSRDMSSAESSRPHSLDFLKRLETAANASTEEAAR